jgi:hypothetical protein
MSDIKLVDHRYSLPITRHFLAFHLFTLHSSLFTLRLSLFTSRVDVEKGSDDDQHQAFHEYEKARDERAILVVRVRVSDERSEYQSTRQPD